MTRKDFVVIAEIINNIEDKDTRNLVAANFAHSLKKTNDRFDVQRFVSACTKNKK
jgi:hypothetical protein